MKSRRRSGSSRSQWAFASRAFSSKALFAIFGAQERGLEYPLRIAAEVRSLRVSDAGLAVTLEQTGLLYVGHEKFGIAGRNAGEEVAHQRAVGEKCERLGCRDDGHRPELRFQDQLVLAQDICGRGEAGSRNDPSRDERAVLVDLRFRHRLGVLAIVQMPHLIEGKRIAAWELTLDPGVSAKILEIAGSSAMVAIAHAVECMVAAEMADGAA